MASLRAGSCTAQPTPTHKFLRILKDRGSLLRTYTQNIDGLEARVGLNLGTVPLRQNDALQLHGDIHRLKCFLCAVKYDYNPIYTAMLMNGEPPECPSCADKCAIRVALGRRYVAIGTLRPDIVLYGEQHPARNVIANACTSDLKRKPDCLVIAGTSLKVPGLKTLIKNFAKAVHASGGQVIFINSTDVITSEWSQVIDYHVQCRSDDFVQHLKVARPDFFTKQSTLDAVARVTKVVSCGTKPLTDKHEKNIIPVKAKAKAELENECEKTGYERIALVTLSNGNKENIVPDKVDFGNKSEKTGDESIATASPSDADQEKIVPATVEIKNEYAKTGYESVALVSQVNANKDNIVPAKVEVKDQCEKTVYGPVALVLPFDANKKNINPLKRSFPSECLDCPVKRIRTC